MFKCTVGDLEVKKIVDKFEEQENIPPFQENGQQIQEHDGKEEQNNEKQQEEALPQPLQEVQHENTPQLVHMSTRPHKPSQAFTKVSTLKLYFVNWWRWTWFFSRCF